MSMNSRGWIILVIIVVLVGAIVLYWTRDHKSVVAPSQADSESIQATFECKNDHSITAVFDNKNNTVQLSLSDGRQITLPRALSADGARYANGDESFVFWNVGDTAFITEGERTTYENCVTSS